MTLAVLICFVMSGQKEREVDRERRGFNEKWTAKIFSLTSDQSKGRTSGMPRKCYSF